MLVSVELTNFRSHKHTLLEFPETGIIALVGLNGTGKTSLFIAIGKCLFFHSPLTLNDLVMEGEKTAEVEVKFTSVMDGELCTIYNQFSSGKDSRSIFKAEYLDTACEGSEDVQQFIKQHLGLPEDSSLPTIWSDSVGVQQSMFVAPFEIEITKRRKIFNDLLGVTRYEKAYSNLSAVESELLTRTRILETELKAMPTTENLEQATQAVQQKTQEGSQLKEDLQASENELEVLSSIVEKYELMSTTQLQRERLEGALDKHKQALEVRAAIEDLKPVVGQQTALERRLRDLWFTTRSVKAAAQAKIQMLEDRIMHLDNTECKCDLCGSDLTLELRQSRKEEAEAQVQALIDEQNNTIQSINNKIAEIERALDDLGNPHDQMKILVNKCSWSDITQIQKEIEEMEGKLEKLPEIISIDLESKAKRDQLMLAVGSMRQQLSNLRRAFGLAKSAQKLMKVKLSHAEQKQQELLDYERKLVSIRELRSGIRAIGPVVAEKTISLVSQKAQLYLSQMLPYSGMHIKWTSDYIIECKIDGVSRKFEKLSGGEKMIFALSIRLALIDHISGLGIVFLDEPTTHLDSDNREYLAKCMQRIKGFEQLFIITHDDTFDDVCDTIISFNKKEN